MKSQVSLSPNIVCNICCPCKLLIQFTISSFNVSVVRMENKRSLHSMAFLHKMLAVLPVEPQLTLTFHSFQSFVASHAIEKALMQLQHLKFDDVVSLKATPCSSSKVSETLNQMLRESNNQNPLALALVELSC